MSYFDVFMVSNDPRMVDVLTGPSFPIAYTEKEGGCWKGIPDDARNSARPMAKPAAVLFEDGSIFDAILYAMQIDGGWRKWPNGYKPRIRVPSGRAAA